MINVFYLGPEGSYSHILTKKTFSSDYSLEACLSFSEIINKTIADTASFGVLPIENSITSNVHENFDYLFTGNLHIVGENFLKINLHLIGLKSAQLTDISTVYSHHKALSQCASFIKDYHLKAIEAASTAAGKDIVLDKDDKTIAAIGSKNLASHPSLHIIKENIGDQKHNITRFVFVTNNKKNAGISGKKSKASVTFKVRHKPGALSKILEILAKDNFNITKIESRPIPGTNWEYNFWIDIESHTLSPEKIERIFIGTTVSYRILGIYKRGDVFES